MAAASSDQTNENTVIASENVNSEPISDIKNVMHKLSNILDTSENISSTERTTSSVSKSSTEIISELFGAFNAEPPILSDTFSKCADDNSSNLRSNSSEDSLENALSPKRKSSKKKHKHKSKKHKKRPKSDKDLKDSSKHSNMKRRSSDDQSVISVISSSSLKEEIKMLKDPVDDYVLISSDENPSQSEDIIETSRIVSSTNSGAGVDSNLKITIDSRSVRSTEKDEQPKAVIGVEKTSKTTSKISIKNLKFSSVFEATIKEVEEQAKAKAEMYEEGEISNSSDEVRSEKIVQESDEPTEVPSTKVDSSSKTKSIDSKPHTKRNHSPSPDHKSSTKKRLKDSKTESSRHKHRSSEDSRHRSHRHHESKRNSRSHSRDTRSTRKIENGHKSRSRDRSRTKDRNKNKSHDLREKLSEKRKNGHSHRRRSEDKQDHSKRSEDKQDHGKRSEEKNDHGKRSEEKHDHGKRSEEKHDRGRRSEDKHDNGRSDDKHGHSRRREKRRRQHSTSPIDKKKLMAIARKNALFLLEQSALPGPIVQEKIVNIKAGGKSVAELTDFCKRLSKREAKVSGSEGENDNESGESDVEQRPFHHPFQIKERPLSIVMNIRNSVPVPANALLNKASDQTLRVQFPVSSGTQHRKTENEWVPVEPKAPAPKQLLAITASAEPLPVPPPILPPQVFPEPSLDSPDISNIVSQRLRAMRKLQENPNDVQALSLMYNANQEMKTWAESKQLPGQFTGSTDIRMLSVSELSAGAHAYVRKDQFVTAAPVTGGMGMSLLQKMGWRPGEGLGKNKGGSLEPLSLEIKMDKKGLVTREDLKHHSNSRASGRTNTNNKSLSDKHPISLLIEFCTRRKWRSPYFEITHESGPDHKKNFLFKVQVNGVTYEPATTSPNKKLAKADAAAVCLRALGVPID